jgi:hypothetical protein
MSTSPPGLVPIWARDAVPVERDANVLFVCFASATLRDDVKLQVDRFGVSSVASFRAVDVREHRREASPEWFDNWRSGPLRAIASGCLGGDLSALDAADRCFTFDVTARDPADLAHLQSIWAVSRWFFERGASVLLDAHAMRFLTASAVPDPRAVFDVKCEVSLVVETDATEPNGGHVVHTRGLRKVGRPDVVAVCSPEDVDLVADVIWQVAAGMAAGFLPALPRHGIDVTESESWYLVADDGDRFAQRLGLNNDARVLVDALGAPLTRG